MAKGDVRSSRGYGGRGRSSSSYRKYYDDAGRGESMTAWEWFERNYTASGFDDNFLLCIDDENCYQLVRSSTTRYGLEDITSKSWHDEDYNPADDDSRAQRIVVKHSSHKVAMWVKCHEHLVRGYERWRDKLEQERKIAQENWEDQARLMRIAREAEAAKLHRELEENVNKIIELTGGAIRSDFDAVLDVVEAHNQYIGDELEDVVEGYSSGRGYIEEVKRPGGIKLQITLSIDLSNSMYYNNICDDAILAYFEIGIALKQMKIEHPNDLFIGFFGFSGGVYGKHAGIFTKDGSMLNMESWYISHNSDDLFENTAIIDPNPQSDAHAYELSKFYRPYCNIFQGEDTWISPLFEQIAKWEEQYSDPGAVRLDIIITDAVLEHVSDIRNADIIQEKRNGNLQTILLNLMPEEKWSDGTLPKRCVQYGATKDNISGILRQILSEFISANL
jgi:hypothetical protein